MPIIPLEDAKHAGNIPRPERIKNAKPLFTRPAPVVKYTMTRTALALLLITALAAGHPRPAQAQTNGSLTVTAPTPGAARTLGDWYSDHIPLRYRATGPLPVRELAATEMDTYLQHNPDHSQDSEDTDTSDIDGVFDNAPDRLTLRIPPDGAVNPYTFAHEYGHYVWYHLFTPADRAAYQTLYQKQRDAHRLVTRYAATDAAEGFAEAFSFYAAESPILLHRDPVSYEFLSHWHVH